jgi:MEMO1 family protein
MATQRSMSRRNFYAGDLAKQVKEFLAGFEPPDEPAELVAGVVPHAGWMYSGKVAARVWRTLALRAKPETVIIFGAVHTANLHQNAVYAEGSWETPIGDVEVDSVLAREILAELKHLVVADPSAHDDEHSIEVHVPMVKAILPKAKIVPIAVPPSSNPVRLGDLLGHLVRDRRAVAVGSSDLTHYGEEHFAFAPRGTGPAAHEWMKANDRRVLDLIENLLADEIVPEVASHHNACGPGALAAVTAFAKARGAERGNVLEQTTSYDVAPEGTFTGGVGYAGVVF